MLMTHTTLDESLSATQRAANRANKLGGDSLSWGRILRIRDKDSLERDLPVTIVFVMCQIRFALWAAVKRPL